MGLKSPNRCVMEMGYICNLTCKTCNIWKSDFQDRRSAVEPMSKENISSLLENLAAAGIRQITFVGGEPLLFPGIIDAVQKSYSLGMKVAVVSNGTLLSPITGRRLFEAGLHTLIVSIDGPSQVHDFIRGKPGTFSMTYENLHHLSRLKKKEGRRLPIINIYTTLSQLNGSSIPSLLAIAQKLDINSIRFQLISIVTPELRHQTEQIFSSDVVGFHSYAVDADLKPQPAEVAKIRRTITQSFSWARRTGIRIQVEAILSPNPPVNGCAFIENSMVITPTGEIMPCPMLTNLSLGNLCQIPFSKIWGNPAHQNFLRRFNQERRLPICQECCVEKLAPVYPKAIP